MTSSSGQSVVFVSGIFNTIHPGHIRFLRFAAEQADRLVVGLFADSMMAEEMQILPFEDRRLALNALSDVDDVVQINNNLASILRQLRPQVVVKGREFRSLENPERHILQEWSGKLLFSSGEQHQTDAELLHKRFNSDFLLKVEPQQEYFRRHNVDAGKLLSIIGRFNQLKVAVFGDVIVDEYVDCDAVGMSLEDPTIVVSPLETRKFVGGAGIVAAHASRLGASVDFYTMLGDDSNGRFVSGFLEDLEIGVHAVVDATRPTTTKRRYRASNKTLLRVNKFRKHELSNELSLVLSEKFRQLASQYDLLLFSDFSYGLLSPSFVETIRQHSEPWNLPVAADSQTSSQVGDLAKFRNLMFASPTEHEVRVTMRDMDESLVKVSERLMKELNVRHLMATMGESGALILTHSDRGHILKLDSLPALNKNPVDVAGAGDAMFVSCSMALTAKANIWESAYIGAIASACQVGRLGNVPLSQHELTEKISVQ